MDEWCDAYERCTFRDDKYRRRAGLKSVHAKRRFRISLERVWEREKVRVATSRLILAFKPAGQFRNYGAGKFDNKKTEPVRMAESL
jgi:hypothetical protein